MGISHQGLSRRHFMGGVGGLAVAAGVTLPAAAASNCGTGEATALPAAYFITNVRLESGFEYEGDAVVGTKTELKTLHIEDGKIKAISEGKPAGDLPAFDAGGLLMLPTFRDLHIHMDKTYYGGPWKAVRPNPNGVFDRIKEEQVLLPKLLATAEERTGKMIDLMHSKGTTIARSHCNVDPVQGLQNLEHLHNVLEARKAGIEVEIVAFPQHGLLYSKCEGLMRDALKTGLITYVGGLDPSKIDGAMEQSIDTMVQMALDFDKGIDIHLHEGAPTGIAAISRIMDKIEENKKQLQGRVTISHAFSLATLREGEDKDYFTRMGSLGMTVATSVPLGPDMMPLKLLRQCGVDIICGTDSVIDWWSPFGSCDILQKCNLVQQLYWDHSEFGLNRGLGYATGWLYPLSEKGEQVWPKPGVDASVNFVPASCSAEAVARLPDRSAVLHKGVLVAGGLNKAA